MGFIHGEDDRLLARHDFAKLPACDGRSSLESGEWFLNDRPLRVLDIVPANSTSTNILRELGGAGAIPAA